MYIPHWAHLSTLSLNSLLHSTPISWGGGKYMRNSCNLHMQT